MSELAQRLLSMIGLGGSNEDNTLREAAALLDSLSAAEKASGVTVEDKPKYPALGFFLSEAHDEQRERCEHGNRNHVERCLFCIVKAGEHVHERYRNAALRSIALEARVKELEKLRRNCYTSMTTRRHGILRIGTDCVPCSPACAPMGRRG